MPVRLKWKLGSLDEGQDEFRNVGEVRRLWITGIFPDRSEIDLSRSKLTTYESSAPYVITVDPKGSLTAVGPGSANVTVRNGNARIVIPLAVPDKQ